MKLNKSILMILLVLFALAACTVPPQDTPEPTPVVEEGNQYEEADQPSGEDSSSEVETCHPFVSSPVTNVLRLEMSKASFK